MNVSHANPKVRKTVFWINFARFLIGLGILAVAYGYLAFVSPKSPWAVDKNDLALFGNFLQGAVASVWSLAAFVFIYVAFLGQQEDLNETRKRAAIQEKTATLQRFENSVFSLLRLHRSIVDRVNAHSERGPIGGTDAFVTWYKVLGKCWDIVASDIAATDVEKVQRAYSLFYQDAQSELGHYFRSFYHIVRYVDMAELTDSEKRRYQRIVRAQLSSVELKLLFYNGLSTFGDKRFKPLIEKYALLKQIPKAELLSPKHAELYQASAFQN
jgi:hypothetical protein